jgi:serine/threonine protein kinase/tetratricopeptide (TPR) repeat protein
MSKPLDPKSLFQDALERPRGDRAAFLDAACGGDLALRARVDALLAADELAGPFLASPTGGAEDSNVPQERAGDLVGHFKLRQQIGEGGFGIVWLAEQQQPVRRQVALKVVKRGMDTRSVVARFEQERQALAMMDHPNIAKVFDGGETPAGRPYFAMELVRGVPITQYCDQQHLDAKERLSLFVLVCHAVQHAHQKGIIHRDIKPTNVLVMLHDGVPVPKVIDFGIAKAVHRPLTEKTLVTEFQQMIGTPEYMSPEQAELSGLDIDTRADIYSLGVLLYELLTGTLPFDAQSLAQQGLLEMLRAIREDEPQKPSTRVATPGAGTSSTQVAKRRRTDARRLGKLLRGDLDWIVMMALEKDRARRYVSADALAADVQRHLDNEPVQASPPNRIYQLRKYCRRHRVGVSATALAATSLVVGLSAALWGFLRASHDRDLADLATDKAEAQTFIANAARGEAVAEAQKKTEALGRAESSEAAARSEALRASIVLDFVDQLLTSANPRQLKSRNYSVRELLDEFSHGFGAALIDQPDVEASVRRLIGRAYHGLGLFGEAEPHLVLALELRSEVFGRSHCRVAESMLDLAVLRLDLEQLVAAEELGQQSLAIHRALHGNEHLDVAKCLGQLGAAHLMQGRIVEAEDRYQEALAILRKLFSEPHPEIAASLNGLAGTYLAQWRLGEAERLFWKVEQMCRQLHGDVHSEVAMSLANLAQIIQQRGRLQEAEELYKKALTMYRRCLGKHPAIVACLNNFAALRVLQYEYQEADQLSQQALEMLSELYPGDEHPMVAALLGRHSTAVHFQERFADARMFVRQAMVLQRNELKPSPQDPDTALNLSNLAVALRDAGDYDEADLHNDAALETAYKHFGPDHPLSMRCLETRATLRAARNHFGEAIAFHQQVLFNRVRRYTEDHVDVAKSLCHLGDLYTYQSDFGAAGAAYQRAFSIRRKLLGNANELVASVGDRLAGVLKSQRRFAEAVEVCREVTAVLRNVFGHTNHKVAVSLCRLGDMLHHYGRREEAEAQFREAIVLFHNLAIDDDLGAAVCREGLSRELQTQRRFAEAEVLLEEALVIRRQHPNSIPDDLAADLYSLGVALQAQYKLVEAEAALQESLEIRSSSMAPDSPGVLEVLYRLGSVLSGLGRFTDAEVIMRRSLEIDLLRLPPGDREVAVARHELGVVLLSQGKVSEAMASIQLCLQCPSLPESDSIFTTALANLALAFAQQGDLEKAEGSAHRALILRRAHSQRLDVANSLYNLAEIQRMRGNLAEAEANAREALEICQVQLEPGDELIATCLVRLAAVRQEQGQHENAVGLLEQALALQRQSGDWRGGAVATIERLIESYEVLGKAEDAAKWLKVLDDERQRAGK